MKLSVKENGKSFLVPVENEMTGYLDFGTEVEKETVIKTKINDEVKIDVASEIEIVKEITASFTIKVAGNNNQYCSKSCQYHGFASAGEVCYFFFNYVCDIEKKTGKRLRCIPCKSESFFENGSL